MRILHSLAAIVVALLLTSCMTSQKGSPLILKHDPRIVRGMLDNGLTYSILENPEPKNRLALRLVVKAGSALEDDDQQGLAHVVEHMAFNGTKSFRKQALVDYLEKMGVNFGAHLNAYTSFDETVYMLEVPTDSENADLVDTAFKILSEWAGAVEFEGEEIDKERGVVIEEWRLRRGARQRLNDKQLPVVLQDSRYAERLPIGKKDILETFKHERLVDYYNDWYRPDLMHVIAVGPMDKAKVKGLINKHFGGLTSRGKNPEHGIFDIPIIPGTLYTSATDLEATESTFRVSYKLPPEPYMTREDYRHAVQTSLVTAMLNRRLREIAHAPDAPFLSAYCYHSNFNPTRDFFGVGGKTKNGKIEDGLEAVMIEVLRAARNGFTDRELTVEKRSLNSLMDSLFKEKDQIKSSNHASAMVSGFLEDRPVVSVEERYAMTMEFLPEITVEQLNALLASWITEDGRVVQVSSPEKTGLIVPDEESLETLMANVEKREIAPYKDALIEAPLFATKPVSGAIIDKKSIRKVDAEEWTLSNGITIVTRHTDYSKDEVLMRAFSKGGHSLATDTEHLSAVTATSIASESGLGQLGKIQLEKKMAGIQAGVSPYINELYEGFSGSASPEDLEMMFKLIHLYFTQPRFDEKANDTFLTRLGNQVENRRQRPEAAFVDLMQRELSNNHPRRRPWVKDMLKELDFDKSVNFYKERFADASDFTFFFVGNFKKKELKRLCELYLGSLPSLRRDESWKDVGLSLPPGEIVNTMYKGKGEKGLVKIAYTDNFEWSRANRMLVNVTCRILSIRLREQLREELSGTYGVSARPSFTHYPSPELQVSIDFGCSPQRTDDLVHATISQIKLMKREKIKEEYLDKVKALMLNAHETNIRENGYWLSNLVFCYQHNESPESILEFEKLLEDITPEDVQNCIKNIMKDDRVSMFKLLPESFNPKGK